MRKRPSRLRKSPSLLGGPTACPVLLACPPRHGKLEQFKRIGLVAISDVGPGCREGLGHGLEERAARAVTTAVTALAQACLLLYYISLRCIAFALLRMAL